MGEQHYDLVANAALALLRDDAAHVAWNGAVAPAAR